MLSRVLGVIVCLQICAGQMFSPYGAGGWPRYPHETKIGYPDNPSLDYVYPEGLQAQQRSYQHGSGDLKDLARQCLARDLTYGPVDIQVPGVCKKFTCVNEMDGNVKKAKVRSQGCVTRFVSPPCYTTEEDNSLSFPDCCSRVVCPS